MDEFKEADCGCNDDAEKASETTDNAATQGISVSCNNCCEKQTEVTFNACEDVKDITVQDVLLKGEARFLKVRVNLDRVCSGRKIALAVLVCENVCGTFFTRGIRACEFTVPGIPGKCTQNVNVGEFCFVFPEDDLCGIRKFKVNVVAHYSSFPSFPFCVC
jgi:hypothetical protein